MSERLLRNLMIRNGVLAFIQLSRDTPTMKQGNEILRLRSNRTTVCSLAFIVAQLPLSVAVLCKSSQLQFALHSVQVPTGYTLSSVAHS